MSSKRTATSHQRNRPKAAVQVPQPNCCQACCREWNPCQPWFPVEEPSTKRKLDVGATFGPVTALAFMAKTITCGYIAVTQVMAWLASPNLSFYYAYFTSWALLLAFLYAILSYSNSLWEVPQPLSGRVGGRAKLTWIIFSIAVVAQGVATVIYWTVIHDFSQPDQVEYLAVATHGIVFSVVCVDGFLISRIPLRWMYIWLSWLVIGAFLVWSKVHEVLGIGNPNENDNDESTNDDAIYSSLSWREEDLPQTVVLAAGLLIVVVPILFAVLRIISSVNLCSCCCGNKDRRRYLRDDIERGYFRAK